jgi:hypothetical protein
MAGNDPHWIEHAHLNKGAFGKKAAAAGESTSAYASKEKGAPGKTGRQARLAQVLGGLRKATQ